jgi:hypothetical protein
MQDTLPIAMLLEWYQTVRYNTLALEKNIARSLRKTEGEVSRSLIHSSQDFSSFQGLTFNGQRLSLPSNISPSPPTRTLAMTMTWHGSKATNVGELTVSSRRQDEAKPTLNSQRSNQVNSWHGIVYGGLDSRRDKLPI